MLVDFFQNGWVVYGVGYGIFFVVSDLMNYLFQNFVGVGFGQVFYYYCLMEIGDGINFFLYYFDQFIFQFVVVNGGVVFNQYQINWYLFLYVVLGIYYIIFGNCWM